MKKIIKAFALLMALICSLSAFASCNASGDSNDDKNADGKIEFYIIYKSTKIELDKKADNVLSALGNPKSADSLGECKGVGEQIRYTYDNLILYTIKSETDETIDQIAFLNDLIETPRNICIGDSGNKVIEAYGTPTAKADNKIEYESGTFLLKFGLESNGNVKSINFIRFTPTN